jgi:hypothetical protein
LQLLERRKEVNLLTSEQKLAAKAEQNGRQNSKEVAMLGSRPGERRGGRKKGTPNKKTAYVRAVTAAHSANPNVTPLEVMLAVMRDSYVALDMRVKLALRLLPRLHRKLGAGESACVASGPNLGPKRRHDPSPAAEHFDEASVENRGIDGREIKYNGAASITKHSLELPTNASIDTRTGVVEGGNGTGLMPLSFLLGVLHNAEAPAAMKIKVASATLPYTQPRQSKRPATPTVVADRHGFAVDPVIARKLRNAVARLDVLKRRRKPTVKERAAARRLGEKIRALVAILPCPSVEEYTTKDATRDKERMLYLWRKRRSRAKLTAKEDADLAHVNARYWAYQAGPESRARERLRFLSEKARAHRLACGPALGPWEAGELSVLATVYRPRKYKLSKADEALLEEDSIFSYCEYDVDGFAPRYHWSNLPAAEATSEWTSETAAKEADDLASKLEDEDRFEEDLT